jgi:hypothetical protein
LYEFFKNLNGAPDHDDVELSVLSESLQENIDFDHLNIHLNNSITSFKRRNSSEKVFNLLFNTDVNNFPKQLKMVIGRKFLGSVFAYSTLDNTFVIYGLFELLKLKKKKLFCAFIDFEKAFDTVWRDGLWYKLLMCNIKGKMYNGKFLGSDFAPLFL